MNNLSVSLVLLATIIVFSCKPKTTATVEDTTTISNEVEKPKIDFTKTMAYAGLALENSIRLSVDSSIYMSMDCDDCTPPLRVTGSWILDNFELQEYPFTREGRTVLEELLEDEDTEIVGAVVAINDVLTPWGQVFFPEDLKLPEEFMEAESFVFSPTGSADFEMIDGLCQFGNQKGEYYWCGCILNACMTKGSSVCQDCPPAVPSKTGYDAFLEYLSFDPVFDPVPYKSKLIAEMEAREPKMERDSKED